MKFSKVNISILRSQPSSSTGFLGVASVYPSSPLHVPVLPSPRTSPYSSEAVPVPRIEYIPPCFDRPFYQQCPYQPHCIVASFHVPGRLCTQPELDFDLSMLGDNLDPSLITLEEKDFDDTCFSTLYNELVASVSWGDEIYNTFVSSRPGHSVIAT